MNWLKSIKNWYLKYQIYIRTVIGVGLIVLILFLLHRPKEVITVTKDNLELLEKTKRYYIDQNEKTWAELRSRVISEKEAKERAAEYAKALKLKPKEIAGATVVVSKTDTVYKDLKTSIIRDTIYRLQQSDGYVDIVSEAGPSIGKISYSGRDTLTIIPVVKNPLIGKTTTSLYIKNSNPSIKIMEGFSYSIKEKSTVVALSLYAGYDPFLKKPSIGIAITKPLFSFKR